MLDCGALQERDAVVERWLHTKVAVTYDAMRADPARALDAKTVANQIKRTTLKSSRPVHEAA